MSKNTDVLQGKGHLLGQKIKQTRMTKGLTQETLAEESEITLNYLGVIEIGNKIPSLKVLIKIATVLGVKTHDLIPF